jgi:hypothetical protein
MLLHADTMGRPRITVGQRAAVVELDRANSRATQAGIARAVGISRRRQAGSRRDGARGIMLSRRTATILVQLKTHLGRRLSRCDYYICDCQRTVRFVFDF